MLARTYTILQICDPIDANIATNLSVEEFDSEYLLYVYAQWYLHAPCLTHMYLSF